MPRLFLACPVPPEAAALLAEWSRARLNGARLVRPENLHVTVKFFGEDDIDRRVRETLALRWRPVVVTTGALAVLGRTAISVSLQSSGRGLPKRPHVTLARSRYPNLPSAPPPKLQFLLERLILFESVLGPCGAEHIARAEAAR